MLNTQRKGLRHLWWIGAQYPFKFSSVNFPNLQKLESKKKKKFLFFFFNLDSLAAKVLEFVRLGQSNTLVQDLEGRVEWRLYFCCTCFFSEKYRHGGIFFPPEAALT